MHNQTFFSPLYFVYKLYSYRSIIIIIIIGFAIGEREDAAMRE
jgi:hypothetical protein